MQLNALSSKNVSFSNNALYVLRFGSVETNDFVKTLQSPEKFSLYLRIVNNNLPKSIHTLTQTHIHTLYLISFIGEYQKTFII